MTTEELRALIRDMSLQEKIAQVSQIGMESFFANSTEPTGPMRKFHLSREQMLQAGSLIGAFGIDEQQQQEIRRLVGETKHRIPPLIMCDVIHGMRSIFPIPLGMGASFSEKNAEIMARTSAEEATARGIHVTFAPMADVVRDPRWGRCVESYGEDPYLVGELGKQMVIGLQAHGLVATPKHFAVYSIPVGGRDGKTRTDPHVGEREMRTLYLEPFRKAIAEAGALGVMSSYNDYNGEPITGSRRFLTDILRHEWGFKGYVVSDSEALEFIYTKHHVAASYEDACALAVNAGLNVRTQFTQPSEFITPLRQAVASGKISRETLDERVGEVLRVKFWLGLFDQPYRGDAARADRIVHSEPHRQLALDAARQSMVLLKNDSATLPLSAQMKRVAVIGPNADARPISRYGPAGADVVSVVDGVRQLLPQTEVVYAKGCEIRDPHYPESEVCDFEMTRDERLMMDSAVNVARDAEAVIVVLGDDDKTVGEGNSRTTLNLPGRQEQLLREIVATGRPVVLVLMAGRATTINYAARHVPAIINACFPGEYGGQAVAEVIFGAYNPGGRLTCTTPRTVGQIPYAFPFKPGSDVENKSSLWGCLFPFGHGLSYTRFEYSDLVISRSTMLPTDSVTVTAKVKNVGSREGDEVVQLYVRDEVSTVTTYTQVLRGFERISLKPGESQMVTFRLGPADLALWDKDMRFVVEPGDFTLMVGASSKDIRLTGTLNVTRP